MANLDEYYDNLKTQTNNQLGLYLFCCSIGVIWTVYVLFFNSRVVGSVFTFFINLYLKRYSSKVWIRIRSLSISFLSGKIMFRGVHYVTIDYMVYVQDGWITFSYWKPQFVKESSKETQHDSNSKSSNNQPQKLKRTARLNIFLCNFQIHYYNSWKTDTVTKIINTNVSGNLEKENENKFFTSQQAFKKNFSSSSIFNLFANQANKANNQVLNNNSTSASTKSGLKSSSINNNNNLSNNDYNFTEDLMQLFSVVNIRIQKGRIFAGNASLPSTLAIKLSNSKMELVTEKSQSKVDDYCFILKGEINKLEISLIPNKKNNIHDNYINMEKKIENRVLIFRSVATDFKYVQDVPSILTFDRRYLQKTETGELIQNEKEPQWSLLLNCNKHTIINYGPWYDRQREALWKFFFPPNYEKLEPQPEPTLNERRQTSKFDFMIYLKDPNSEINIPYAANNFKFPDNFDFNMKNDFKKYLYPVEKKLTFKCRSESYLECSIPWLTRQFGYKTTIKGKLNNVLTNTNMSFKELINADSVKFDIDINYPLDWNDMQTWNFDIEFFRSTIFIVYYHKNFFQDLINDWSSRVMADMRTFVPYVYNFNIKANDIEVVLPCNEHNWIDVHQLENNTFFEIQASRADLKIGFPFKEFLPQKTNIELDIKVHDACARFIVPPFNNNLILLKMLRKNINYVSNQNKCHNKFESKKWSRFNQIDRDTNSQLNNSKQINDDGEKLLNNNSNNNNNKKQAKSSNKNSNQLNKKKPNSNNKQGQKYNKSNSTSSDYTTSSHFQENWFECWQTNYVSVVLNFDYHPCSILDWQKLDLPSVHYYLSLNSPKFNCEIFEPDVIDLKIEIGPSNVMLYGTFLKCLWFIKEGYFSWDQFYTDIIDLNDLNNLNSKYDKLKNEYNVSKQYYDVPLQLLACNQKDPRNFRPLSVNLSLAIHNITGHLVLDTNNNVPFPIGFTDRLALELEKTYNETKLQLYVDPINIFVEDLLQRSYDQNLSQGHLCLSSIQVRGHAMFSDESRLKTDTLEYAWLLEILMGDLTGSITPVQTEQVIHGVETLITLMLENEYKLQNVFQNRIDPGLPFKYEITRFSLDLIDIYLVESGTALNFNLHPVRLSICNSHTDDYAKGLSACISEFKLILYLNELSRNNAENQHFSPTSQSNDYSKLGRDSFNKERFSNYSSSTISLSSLGSSATSYSISSSTNTYRVNSDDSNTSLCKDDLFKSNNIDDTLSDNMATLTRDNVNKVHSNYKLPDSNEFNYWFECSSFSSGKIVFDLALDKGNPEEQLEFLRMHDLKTKRLYFLWSENEILNKSNEKIIQTFTQNGVIKRRCGCYGGCSYYSVFDRNCQVGDFFDLSSSITRSNPNYGDSLFSPGKHILLSQEIMLEKYEIQYYSTRNDIDITENLNSMKNFNNELLDPLKLSISDEESSNINKLLDDNVSIKSLASTSKFIVENLSQLSSNKTNSYNSVTKEKESIQQKNNFSSQKSSTISLYSLNQPNTNEEDFYTADEQDESDSNNGENVKRKKSNENDKNSKRSSDLQSSFENKLDSSTNYFEQDDSKNETLKINNNNKNNNNHFNESKNYINEDVHMENKMALNFDIQRPILDSSLPKYCYLKYLSRASVSNWNKSNIYPYFHDYKDKNIFFTYRQKGIDFSQVNTKSKNSNTDPSKKAESNNYDLDLQVNCRANLEFSTFECYITPLALTALGRFTKALHSYQISPNSLITELQTKAQAHCANPSIIEAISKTQVSLKIPQIRLFSLQCGLAEGDKICDAFVNTLANPDDFITLSIFSIAIYNIQTQLIDSLTKTATIFQIDKIDSQFCRLFNSPSNEFSNIKLSCIPEEYSNTSIKCFKEDKASNNLKSLIMYESVFDQISIKAIKKANETIETSKVNTETDDGSKNLSKVFDKNETLNKDLPNGKKIDNNQKRDIDKFSLFEFDIAKIWFSFPEPPTSPKGKRKIPYTRHDWNLLSSVSPAVTSWLCASKYTLNPLKEFIMYRNDLKIKNMAALIIGSLKNKEELDDKIDMENQLEKFFNFSNSNEANLSTRLKNKIGSNKSSNLNQTTTAFQRNLLKNSYFSKSDINNYGQKFLQLYLKKSSLAYHCDPNCRLTNVMRNYLYYFEDEFNADLESETLPEIKYLKRGINEVLNSWTSSIMSYIGDFNHQPTANSYLKSSALNNQINENMKFNHEVNMGKTGENFKFFTEIRETKAASVSNLDLNVDDKSKLDIENETSENKLVNPSNNIGLKNPVYDANQKANNLYLNAEPPLLKSNNPSLDESLEANNSTFSNNNDETNRLDATETSRAGLDKTSFMFNQDKLLNDDVIDKALHSGHVGPQLRNTSKIFKPILNFIGIDAPSGTIMDNLFKEFGSLLFGNLNIKSVDINILGKKLKNSDNFSNNYEKVITTILSFDELLVSINVRQVMPKELTISGSINTNKINNTNKTSNKNQETSHLSMTNPVYQANSENNDLMKSSNQLINSPKYYTKIDAGIQLNNLTQEVNMPLLRLIHQLYSIVADAIEYDKEQNKVIDKINTNNIETNQQIFNELEKNNTKTIKFVNRDCWRYMNQILELRDYVPEPKYVETNEIGRKNSQKTYQKYVHITKDTFFREKSLISIFGWIYVRRINSKAGLGTLAFSGEMNNVQISALLDRKIGSSSKTQYEGSLNMRMDSTLGKLIENDSRQNVVQLFVGKSHLFGYFKNFNINNLISSFIHVGQIYIDIPLRPMVVHGVVYRESKVIEQNILPEIKNFVIFENQDELSSNLDNKDSKINQNKIDTESPIKISAEKTDYVDNKKNLLTPTVASNSLNSNTIKIKKRGTFINNKLKKRVQQHEVKLDQDNLINKFTFQLKSKLDGFEIRAKLLENPCLKAAYLVNNIECNAVIKNEKSKIFCFLNSHCLSFQCDDDMETMNMNTNSQNDEFLSSYKQDEQNNFNGMMSMKPLEERTNFFLPSISLNGSHLSKHIQLDNNVNNSSNNSKNIDRKLLNLIEVLFTIKTSPLNRELNAQVIAQLVFVTKVFIKEMNHILLAVYGLENPSNASTKPSSVKKSTINTNQHTVQSNFNNTSVISRFYYDLKIEFGRISLTGITPTNTALTIFTGEKSILVLKNNLNNHTSDEKKSYLPDNDYTLKPSIEAKCDISVELKTSFNMPNEKESSETNSMLKNNISIVETNNNWFQLAYFNTKFDLRNAVRTVGSHLDRESIIITVEKPRFYLQPGAVDCALLFWLNYKSTYEFWLQQRQQFANFLIDQELFTKSYNQQMLQKDEKNKRADSMTSSSTSIENNYLALKLRVTGLGVALPLSNKMTQDFFKNNTDCLVISLNETVIYACSSGCVVSKGQFNNFSLRFIENFNLSSSEWTPLNFHDPRNPNLLNNSNNKNIMNAWIVPSGNYEICSSTIEKPKNLANNPKVSPIWILSVKWKMEGIEVNLDTNIGKWLSKLADTVTRLAETQNITENPNNIGQDSEIKRLKKELNYYIEKGDTAKINSIQSRIDMLNLASYPERAKQIFVKTRNNLKGQLGFNTNHLATPNKTIPAAPLSNMASNANKLSSVNSESLDSAESTLITTPDNFDSAKSNENDPLRRHSVPNDDVHTGYASRTFNNKNQESLIEENENEIPNKKEKLNLTARHHSQIATSAPAIDFKLNVKIEINSGKCILHANNNKANSHKSNEHLATNGISPLNNYFTNNLTEYQRSGLINTFMQNNLNAGSDQDMRNTNFIFPAIGVKAFYESTHKEINKRLTKKANLYAMIKLESFVMPHSYPLINNELYHSRDMCLSPALLDFLEQTLEPFDMIKASFEAATTPSLNRFNINHQQSDKQNMKEGDNDSNKIIRNSSKENIVNSIETTEQPAYFPVDVVVFIYMLPSSIRFTCLPHSTMECLLKLPTLEMVFSTNRLDSHYQEGLKHKYDKKDYGDNYEELFKYYNNSNWGSQHKDLKINNLTSTNEGGLSVTCSMTDFSLKFYNRLAIRNQVDSRFYYSEHSSYTEDKDSLSVRVAYIKVNISRTRRVTKITADSSTIGSSLNDVKLSVLADIGSSSFTYDMRNIKEVFVFPKIWYRRSLARRLFLGEETSIRVNNELNKIVKSSKQPSSDSLAKTDSKSINSDKFIRPKSLEINKLANSSENLFWLDNSWKTLVLISVNLVGLEIKMNVGNIMGNVCLLTKNARLTSKISTSRFGPKDMLFNFALDNARLIAEGGSNGCLLRIQDITSSIEINDKNKQTGCPFHKVDFLIYATECRIDSAYNQASPILAFRLSNLSLKLNDSWAVPTHALAIENEATKLPEALIELNVTWDQLHLMITRSTTPDLIMLYYKLMDFFEKQFTESKDYIKECELDIFYEIKVKQQFIEKKETLVKKNFNVNGGCIQLKGNNFTLITFHGNNFKAKKWAVFSLNEPSMDFASQTYFRNGELIQQNLGFYLGRNERKKDMASIYMVYRDSNSIFTRFQTINEWFEYAHSNIDAVGLRDFPRFSSDIHPLLLNQSVKKNKVSDLTKWEEIFHLPSLQVFCDTTQENNIVKFEFKTDFHDHIQLTFRTELFGFLHELITSYIKEKDMIKDKEDYIPVSKKDDRIYECTRWDLEPTLRLISKFGSSVEPSGVDGLLKSLGFHHARTTIPKWFQRGLLDNLHEVLHNLIKIYAKMITEYDITNPI